MRTLWAISLYANYIIFKSHAKKYDLAETLILLNPSCCWCCCYCCRMQPHELQVLASCYRSHDVEQNYIWLTPNIATTIITTTTMMKQIYVHLHKQFDQPLLSFRYINCVHINKWAHLSFVIIIIMAFLSSLLLH